MRRINKNLYKRSTSFVAIKTNTMTFASVLENLTNPALLFFALGILSVKVKSTLSIPEGASRFIAIYLLFSIGFKGGQELSHGSIDGDMLLVIGIGLLSAVVVPVLTFFLLKRKLSTANAAAISAAYGSVSAVTFITAVAFLDQKNWDFGGHMVALMAMMEAPAIIVGVTLMRTFAKEGVQQKLTSLVAHAVTNGSVFLLLGSTLIGFLVNEQQAQGIAPFTTDIFKGFLVVFLLDMGIKSGKQISGLWAKGPTPVLFAVIAPLMLGTSLAFLTTLLSIPLGDKLLLTVLVASASYIAVPASMKLAIPEANPGLYTPMALAITFPVNIIIGIPWYGSIIGGF
jgi:hypothetical protein